MSKRELFVILIITFFVIMVWIMADIQHSKPSTELNPKLPGLLEPINPEFDQDTLSKIQQNLSGESPTPNLDIIPSASNPPEASSSSQPLDTSSTSDASNSASFDNLDNQINNLNQ